MRSVSRRLPSRLRVLVVPLAAAAAALAFAWVAASPAGAADRSPFTKAQAVWSRADGGFVISWHADTSRVRVTATRARSGRNARRVGTGAGRGRIIARGLSPDGRRWYFRLTAADGSSLVIADRSLHYPSATNARDFGGYRTASGGWVRSGSLYRSEAWALWARRDLARVGRLGLKYDFDLRTRRESRGWADPRVRGVKVVRISVLDEDDPSVTIGGARTPDEWRAAYKEHGGPYGSFKAFQIQLGLVRAAQGYKRLFRRIIAADGAPILIHCSAGQDRTGVAVYLLHRILGVSHADAMADYLVSRRSNAHIYKLVVDYFVDLGFSEQEALSAIAARGELLRLTLRAMRTVYGSFDAYVRDGLGLSPADVEQLRRIYVTA